MMNYTISKVHALIKNGNLTAEILVSKYLERIDKIDKSGPKINSIIEINPDAIIIAKELDAYYEKNGMKGPLHGIPILIKDNIDTDDKMKTTAGSITIEEYGGDCKKDASIVVKLRRAGAIILGKTNLSEMANFRGKRSMSGWSSRGGRTKNPYVLNRSTSGSSSGSAAAIAANLAIGAIGTETDGSIISPSQANGIVGIKPSLGLVSRAGIIPISHSQDTAGPMTRSVEDACKILNAISGYDNEDKFMNKLDDDMYEFQIDNNKSNLKNYKLGVLRDKFGFHDKVDSLINNSIEKLKELGAEIIDAIELESPENLGMLEFEVLLHEYNGDIINYFENRQNNTIYSLEELKKYNIENEQLTMPFFGQEFIEMALDREGLKTEKYLEAMTAYKIFKENLNKCFVDNNIDALVAPSGGPAWIADKLNGDFYGGGSSQIAAVSGYCNITVPAGYIDELPVGINFIGNRFDDEKIINIANIYEKNTLWRKDPEFIESLEIDL